MVIHICLGINYVLHSFKVRALSFNDHGGMQTHPPMRVWQSFPDSIIFLACLVISRKGHCIWCAVGSKDHTFILISAKKGVLHSFLLKKNFIYILCMTALCVYTYIRCCYRWL